MKDDSFPFLALFASVIQYFPIIYITYKITTTYDRSQIGVSLTSKLHLILAVVLLIPFQLEPSLFNRILLSLSPSIPSKTLEASLCIIPPWWWIDPTAGEVRTHGWASRMDVVLWAGIAGYLFLFSFMRREYRRARKEWTRIVVRELQNTFDFRRY